MFLFPVRLESAVRSPHFLHHVVLTAVVAQPDELLHSTHARHDGTTHFVAAVQEQTRVLQIRETDVAHEQTGVIGFHLGQGYGRLDWAKW